MKIPTALALATLFVASLGTTLHAQTTQSGTAKPTQPKTYDSEQDYEKAYVNAYKGKGHVNAQPISVEVPQVDPLLLEDYVLPMDVKVEFTVTEKGTVKRPVVKTDIDFAIAQDVISAIYNWRFKPAIHDGVPVAERLLVTMQFIDAEDIPAPGPGTYTTVKQKKKGSNMTLTPVPTSSGPTTKTK